MSAQEQITATNWAFTYVRRVFGHTVRKSKDFVLLNIEILRRPTSEKIISDDSLAGLPRAIRYFLKAFGLSFAIFLIANRYQLYEGKSEWRDLMDTIAQFLVTMITIYALCLVLPDRIPFFRLVQAALYAVGAYLLVISVAALAVAFLDRAPSRDEDVIVTLHEKCLADNSNLYWLLRGDLKFYLSSDRWRPENWFLENYRYLLAIPFVFIFALMLRPVRKISFALICIVAAITFVAVDKGMDFARRQSASLLMARDKCTAEFLLDQAISKYAPDRIARQLTHKFTNDVLKSSYTYFSSLAVHGTSLVMPFKLNPGVDKSRVLEQVSSTIRQLYCTDNEFYWFAIRRINYNLLLVMYDSDDTLLDQKRFTPTDCP
jgi:hypothetical protein